MNRKQKARRSGCPISLALEAIGDPWSLLVIRDLMFKGHRAFHEFLNAGEGIASNILSDRLARLEASGILTKRPDPGDGRRFLYRLTEKGIDLTPVLVEMVLWAARHEDTDAPATTLREMRLRRDQFLAEVRRKWTETADG
jgi:DNA-binding HxlR family transcriptional regulator